MWVQPSSASASRLLGVLDAFGDGFEVERFGELHDRVDEPVALVVADDVVDEPLVDLEDVDRELGERGERRVAGAEVVDGDPHAGAAEFVEGGDDAAGLAGEDRLGDLEGERGRVELGACERVGDMFGEAGVRELQSGGVDRDAAARSRGEPVVPSPGLSARLEEHRAAEIDDEARVLGERDERVGRDEPSRRVLPAGERFERRDLAGASCR